MKIIRNIALNAHVRLQRISRMVVLRALNSTINRAGFFIKAKDLAEVTGRLSSKSVDGSISLQLRYRIGLCILAISLLIFAGLSTGLILAICGLDQVWLHMKSITATPKERFIQVSQNMTFK